MEVWAYVLLGLGFFIFFVILNKILTPGVIFQLDSKLRHEQLTKRIEETYSQGLINNSQRTRLLNRLSTNAITQIRIRRLLNRMVRRNDAVPSTSIQNNVSESNIERYLLSSEGILKEIAKGESERREFKETFFFDSNRSKNDKEYTTAPKPNDEMFDTSIGTNIAAFLNTHEGRIFVGISDDGSVQGLERDFQMMKLRKPTSQPVDALRLRYSHRLKSTISNWGAVHNRVELRFIQGLEKDKDIAVIFVNKSEIPVFIKVKGKEEVFATRGSGHVFTDYSMDTMEKYIKSNFPDR